MISPVQKTNKPNQNNNKKKTWKLDTDIEAYKFIFPFLNVSSLNFSISVKILESFST